jgi:hypothetical protein
VTAPKAQAWPFRLVRVEILPGGSSSVSLVLDSSTTLAWIYSDKTRHPRYRFQSIPISPLLSGVG